MEGEPTAEALVCAECGRQPRDDENAADEWRAYRDVDDDLPVFCLEVRRARVPRRYRPP